MAPRLLELQANSRRNHRVAVDLTVRMLDRGGTVLEDEHVPDLVARAELAVAVGPHVDKRLDPFRAELGERRVVAGGVTDPLPGALRGRELVQLVAESVRRLRRGSEPRVAVVEDDDLERCARDLGRP